MGDDTVIEHFCSLPALAAASWHIWIASEFARAKIAAETNSPQPSGLPACIKTPPTCQRSVSLTARAAK
jgi:hypothetical protein